MLRIILVVILLLNIDFSFGARVKSIQNFKSKALQSLMKKSQRALKELNGSTYLNSFAFRVYRQKKNERVESALKKAIYQEYSELYSKPEYASVFPLRKSKINEELASVLEPLEVFARTEGNLMSIQDVILKISHIVLSASSVQVFAFDHGNTFGEGVGVFFFDQKTKEMLALERVYAE